MKGGYGGTGRLCPPKAEVVSSNLAGSAIQFNDLGAPCGSPPALQSIQIEAIDTQ